MSNRVLRFGKAIGLICVGAALTSVAYAQSADDYTALIRADKAAQAEQLANTALAKDANDVAAMVGKVNSILARNEVKRLDEAAELAQRCIDAQPKAAPCHTAKGNALGTKALNGGILSAAGYATQIRDAFKTAIELDPKPLEPRINLLQYYLQAPGFMGGGKDKARALAEDTRKSSSVAGALLMANVLLAEDKPQEAEPLVLGANVGSNSGADKDLQDMQRGSLVNLGAVYLQGKRYADAQRMFEEVARRFPMSNWGAYGQGRVLQEQGKHGDALPLFERAIAMEKPFAAMYLRLAQSYKALGEKAKAIAATERALAFKPALASKQRKEAEALLAELK